MRHRMYYWVIQRKGGQLFLHGPYKAERSRDHRFEEGVVGGEIYRFNSLSSDPEVVKQEFRDAEVRRVR